MQHGINVVRIFFSMYLKLILPGVHTCLGCHPLLETSSGTIFRENIFNAGLFGGEGNLSIRWETQSLLNLTISDYGDYGCFFSVGGAAAFKIQLTHRFIGVGTRQCYTRLGHF